MLRNENVYKSYKMLLSCQTFVFFENIIIIWKFCQVVSIWDNLGNVCKFWEFRQHLFFWRLIVIPNSDFFFSKYKKINKHKFILNYKIKQINRLRIGGVAPHLIRPSLHSSTSMGSKYCVTIMYKPDEGVMRVAIMHNPSEPSAHGVR